MNRALRVAAASACLLGCKPEAPDARASSGAASNQASNRAELEAPALPEPEAQAKPRASAPSCAVDKPGAGVNCGPDQDQDCCAHAPVPGGRFIRAHGGPSCDHPELVATVGDFELDVYEVSVGRFRAFLDAGQGTRAAPPKPGAGAHPRHPGSGWDPAWTAALLDSREAIERELDCGPGSTWTAAPGANERAPINCVNFYEAMAFCAWDGGYLPTEAERNYVASGGEEQRVYPWSTPPDSTHIRPEHAVYASPGTAPVGTHRAGDGRWGHADLAGNVWEWTLDEVELARVLPSEGANFCEPAGMPVPCDDCLAVGAGTARVLRGGGWGLPERGMAVAIRRGGEPDERHSVFGLRCARPLEGAVASETECAPECGERVCGDDGCGGSCGSCEGASVCVAGRCELVEYAAGPFGVDVGQTFPDLRLSAIPNAARNAETMQTLALAEYYTPNTAGTLALYFTTAWAEVDRSAALIAWAAAAPERELLIILLEGERRGQPADVGNLQQFGRDRGLSVPLAMDTLTVLPKALRERPRPELLLIDRSRMQVEARLDPLDPDDAALRELIGG